MSTPPRIRGLVGRLEKAVRMEFFDRANRQRRKSETNLARFELLKAIAVLAGGIPKELGGNVVARRWVLAGEIDGRPVFYCDMQEKEK